MSIITEANNALAEKKYKLAVDLYKNAAKEDPENYVIYQGLAESLLNIRNYKEARYASAKALELNPNLFMPHVVLSYVSYVENNLDDFQSEAKKAYELNPNSSDVLTCFGTMLLETKDLDASIVVLNKSLQINPFDAVARANLASAYLLRGNVKEYYNQVKSMFIAAPSLRAGINLISAFHKAFPILVSSGLLIIVIVAIFLQLRCLLVFPLLYLIYGVWISFQLIFEKKWRLGISTLIYNLLIAVILYVTFKSIN